jgi:hypothetical protein
LLNIVIADDDLYDGNLHWIGGVAPIVTLCRPDRPESGRYIT